MSQSCLLERSTSPLIEISRAVSELDCFRQDLVQIGIDLLCIGAMPEELRLQEFLIKGVSVFA